MENQSVKFLSNGSGYDSSMMPCMNNLGIQRLQHDIAETNRDVKQSEAEIRADLLKGQADIRQEVRDAECNIRHDVKEAECSLTKTVMQAECNLSKEILTSRHLLAEEITKQGYENRLATQASIKEINDKAQYNADRTQDKAAHYFEETREELNDFRREQAICCCKVESALSLLTGGVLPTSSHK